MGPSSLLVSVIGDELRSLKEETGPRDPRPLIKATRFDGLIHQHHQRSSLV